MKGKGEYIGNVGRRQMGAYEVFANRASSAAGVVLAARAKAA